MKTKKLVCLLFALIMALSILAGCGANDGKEEADTITVYMWSTAMYESYAPYIQAQLPDVNIEFVVGNNDLDFYKFLNENGKLPDIITVRRFALHDALPIKDQLMDLSTTDAAGTIYESYLQSFANADGSVNWLPLCGEVDGLVANKALFDQYDIPLPTDYDSLISACKAFEEKGIRGFVSDFEYDYTCMEVLQGLSIPELSSMEGRMWRNEYEDPATGNTGLDDVVWPGAFERMDKFIDDANILPGDLELSYDPVMNMFTEGKAAIIRSGGSNMVELNEQYNIEAVFLPYFGQDDEQWLLTYPQFQVALNKDLENDKTRQENALKVLDVMLSEGAQNALAKGGDVITYSQDVNLEISPYLENLAPLIQQNRMYIRIASNDFFAVSQDVVSKMIKGEYDAKQAYEAFDAQLKQPKEDDGETVLSLDRDYSNIFHKNGGNEAYSAMANTLRGVYGSDVLIAPAYSFTGSVFKADYNEKMVGNMVSPNPVEAWQFEMNGAQLKAYLKYYVEGVEEGFVPFNYGSLPTVSGLTIEVQEADGKYILGRVKKDGKEIGDDETFKVTCLNFEIYMEPIINAENCDFQKEELRVRDEWVEYILSGGTVAEPESYITLK